MLISRMGQKKINKQSCRVAAQLKIKLLSKKINELLTSLFAENRNGTDNVDLDLIVIDEVPLCECDMFLNGNLECSCTIRYRTEKADEDLTRMSTAGLEQAEKFTPKEP